MWDLMKAWEKRIFPNKCSYGKILGVVYELRRSKFVIIMTSFYSDTAYQEEGKHDLNSQGPPPQLSCYGFEAGCCIFARRTTRKENVPLFSLQVFK